MKKILLTLGLGISTIIAIAQCAPDPQFTAAGIYPDSTTGLSTAYVGQNYSQNITIITPTDTIVDVPIVGMTSVTIDNIDLVSVSGLPYGFAYDCDPPSCSFAGGTIKCAELYSTIVPDDSLIGIHNILFSTTTYVSGVPIIGTTTQNDDIDYYYIEISASTSTFNQLTSNSFELKEVLPNPVVTNARIQFTSGSNEKILFRVYNMLGEEIESQVFLSNRGVNTLNINTSNYSRGMYLYSISNGKEMQTKRMIVKN